MTEANYVFNNLSQMTSETRTFNGLGSYNLNYEYNLAGQLKKVTNHWGAEVSYGYDKAGRLLNVSGAGYAGVSNYANALSYRAFGGIKGMNYGDGHSLSTAYDNRLRPTTWNVSGVLGYNYGYGGWHQENTGRVVYAQSIHDSTLDRSYEYDLVGRLAISHSGAEARAHVLGDPNHPWGIMDGPYSQGYDYDVWGNVTHKYGWGGEVHGDGPQNDGHIWYYYANNKRASFTYDAAGNVVNDGGQTFQYDATGQQTFASAGGGWGAAPSYQDDRIVVGQTTVRAVHIAELRTAIDSLRNRLGLANYAWATSATTNDYISIAPIQEMRTALDQALGPPPSPGYALGLASTQPIKAIHIQELRDRVTNAWNAFSGSGISQAYDGDGLRIKKTESGATTYYLRSAVLGGQVLAEISGGAVWQRGYVYAGSSLMAVQQGGVNWVHEDPVTKSKRVTDINGTVVSAIETDPWGADTNRSSNAAFQPRKFTTYDRDANQSDEAMFRRYNRWHSRFDQPDPYDGSYNVGDPQSFNRYAYVQNDPVNFVDPMGLDKWDANPGFIPAWMNGSNRTTNPTQTFINFVAELTTEHHTRLVNDRPWLSFDGWPRFSFAGGGGGQQPQRNRNRTTQQKRRDYENCLKTVRNHFDQAHRNIRNVFHNSLPSARTVAGIGLVTSLRTAGTAVFAGAISVSAAAPLVVSTFSIGYVGAWGVNVTNNFVNNARTRGTLLGEEIKARIACRGFLN